MVLFLRFFHILYGWRASTRLVLTNGSECHGVESVQGAEAFWRLQVGHGLLGSLTKNIQRLKHLNKRNRIYIHVPLSPYIASTKFSDFKQV